MPLQSKHDLYSRKRPNRSTYRLKRTVIHRLTLLAGICCVAQLLRLHVAARSSLKAKYTATAFGDDTGILERYANISTVFDEANRSALLRAESRWRPLGSGFEGSTFTWDGHVIKTFKAKRSPFRNCFDLGMINRLRLEPGINETCTTRWPTEIPASLIAGTVQGFLPVSDAFFARSSSEQVAQWHLVTPLMQGGTLENLARSVSHAQLGREMTAHTLDVRFRPKFDELLVALQHLHGRGLCHDDVKMENIFVARSDTEEDGAWLIGDLGNVRQVSHPYHASALWTHSNGQLPDCRANDALRATKSYLQFLRRASRSATGSASSFDMALFDDMQPWARLFWRAYVTGSGLRSGDLLQWSAKEEHPMSSTSNTVISSPTTRTFRSSLLLPFLGKHGVHEKQSTAALKPSASEG